MERFDPIFKKTKVTASENRGSQLTAANEPPPNSPIDGSKMRLSKIMCSAGIIPVWVDLNNRVVYPVAGK